MADRKKVVRAVETCFDSWIDKHRNMGLDLHEVERMKRDALALLKEQEPREPIYNEQKYGDHLPHCGNCEKALPNNGVYGKVNFCHYCGKVVKWDEAD